MNPRDLQPGTGLRLEVHNYSGPASWRWVLTESGATIAEHDVRLDTRDWQYEAFGDLPGWISWHAAPDTRPQDEVRIVAEVGGWIAANVLGPVAGALASRARRQPVTLSVVIPAAATELAFRPLELAHVDGRPLAVQGVTLITQVGGTTPDDRPDPVRERVRVLGLFSLPEGGKALNLRRERHALVGVIAGIARKGRAADIRVLQYGVTRESLRVVLAEDDGWDIIHISGHGAPGTLVLETDTGHPDPIDAATLATLLAAARGHLKLVTVAACWSAAISADQQRLLLGIRPQSHPDTKRTRHSVSAPSSRALATELTGRLGCAVLAMRYPVDDEFAIALNERLYALLVDKGQPLARAVGSALRELADGSGPAGSGQKFPALSVVTPALFGAAAVDLRLAAPPGTQADSHDPARLELPGFPAQPARFVGRTSVMARAASALARGSRVPGVLLHGMPGGGKTACALELAYNLAHTFDQLIWYKAPEEDGTDEGTASAGSLTNFALTLEQYVPGFQIAHLLASQDQVTAALPRLTWLMAERRLLIVIDNAESLLTGEGGWRDGNWGLVINALTDHSGPGRVLVTSRRVPARLKGARVEVLSVGTLSADEALLFARELPNLEALKLGQVQGIDSLTARQLARRALEAAQNHPKLLELADGQAADPGRLIALIEAGDQAWRRLGRVPDNFFAAGEPTASEADFLDVLSAWTREVATALSPGERDLFWFLCCLEEPDRERQVLDNNWADLWRRLGRDGDPPGLDHPLAAVAASGLAAIRPGAHPALACYSIHPGVAETGRDQAGTSFRDAVDTEAAACWAAVYQAASGTADDGTVRTPLLARAGLAAVPYLVRQQDWAAAASGLEQGFVADGSRANALAMLPYIQRAARHVLGAKATLGLVLSVLNPAAAETVLRECLDAAVAGGGYWTASVAAGRLSDLLADRGEIAEAVDLAWQRIRYTGQAGRGPWTELNSRAGLLRLLNRLDQAERVLGEVTRLRDHMATLPATPGPNEAVTAWNTREALLDTGRNAAVQLGRWADALDLNAAVVASMRDRDAPATTIARARYNDYAPLLRLRRTGEALDVLRDCLQTFQDAGDTTMIGNTLSALADTENFRGHGEAAIGLEHDALRFRYLAGDVPGIATSYHNLGIHLGLRRQFAPSLASLLAAALIGNLTWVGDVHGSVGYAARGLLELGGNAVLPTSVDGLARQIGEIPGAELPRLIERLSPDPEGAERALRDAVMRALELAATAEPQ